LTAVLNLPVVHKSSRDWSRTRPGGKSFDLPALQRSPTGDLTHLQIDLSTWFALIAPGVFVLVVPGARQLRSDLHHATGWESRERHGNNRFIAARVSNGSLASRSLAAQDRCAPIPDQRPTAAMGICRLKAAALVRHYVPKRGVEHIGFGERGRRRRRHLVVNDKLHGT
jgi:hypothetical protein